MDTLSANYQRYAWQLMHLRSRWQCVVVICQACGQDVASIIMSTMLKTLANGYMHALFIIVETSLPHDYELITQAYDGDLIVADVICNDPIEIIIPDRLYYAIMDLIPDTVIRASYGNKYSFHKNKKYIVELWGLYEQLVSRTVYEIKRGHLYISDYINIRGGNMMNGFDPTDHIQLGHQN